MNQTINNINNNGSERTVTSCHIPGRTQIPVPKTYINTSSKMQNCTNSPSNGVLGPDRWKLKYEETEKKRKSMLALNEKHNREMSEMNRKYERLLDQNRNVVQQLTEKHDQLEKLKVASKDFYLEYDTLKNKYEVEMNAYRKAIAQSTKWYRENNKLKRKSAVLVQRMIQLSPDGQFDDFKDVVDSTNEDAQADSEMEEMRKNVQELSNTVARLQAELNSAKLMEFEATEQNINLTQELEVERQKRESLEKEIEKLKETNEHINRVSKLVALEVASMRDAAEKDRENVILLRNEADTARKERNVLAHQSTLLIGEIIPADGDDKILRLVQEIENLKAALEDEKNKRVQDIIELQDKWDDREATAQLEIMEEKLKLVEAELETATERAIKAEKEIDRLKAPTIPPPPPPPPPSMITPTLTSTIKLKTTHTLGIGERNGSAVHDMEKLLGIEQNLTKKTAAHAGAIDDVINQIKGGRFTLKATDKFESKKPKEEPPAVKEMLNVLGTLRRRQKPIRKLAESAFGDVQL